MVVSVTYKTHSPTPLTAAYIVANFSTAAIAKEVMTEFIRLSPALADAGWGGYAYFNSKSLQFFSVAPNISLTEANATISPFFAFASEVAQVPTALTIPYDTFYTWYTTFFAVGQAVGTNAELGSRLLPRTVVEADPARVADAFLAIDATIMWQYLCFPW